MTDVTLTEPASPQLLARASERDVLQTQTDGLPAVVVQAPPGAGKTRMVEDVAAFVMVGLRERCYIATQTNEQTLDVARRFAESFRQLACFVLVSGELPIPPTITALPNLTVARKSTDLPGGACVVIANAERWSWHAGASGFRCNCLIIDEAYQLPDYRFHQIASLADRIMLIGDPGQIEPVVTCEIERWRDDPAGPHVACPNALLARHPDIRRIRLPISRRLTPDTVAIVQPVFYPELPFQASSRPEDRRLELRPAVTGPRNFRALDRLLDRAAAGASLIHAQLPPAVTGERDEQMADGLVAAVERLLARGARVRLDGPSRQMLPGDVGIVCAHVSQVGAIQRRLSARLSGVLVETADRFQGLQRPVMLVWHPLSGRVDVNPFQLNTGRLCVMLSRHQVTCILFGRAGMQEALLRYVPGGERFLGQGEDREYADWRTHRLLLNTLAEAARVVQINEWPEVQ